MINTWRKIQCWLLGHHFTNKHEQGIQPTQEQLDNGLKGFIDYTTLWCERCGKVFPYE